jgi:protein tyrosine phosphatase (PTP) superfamily phosphohydrolase (DUF442 family)
VSAGKKTNAALSEIYNFRKIGERLGTAGQPTETQLRAIREAGFEAVINLALPTSDNALANAYVHIPVDFAAPKPQDFRTFCGVMEALEGRPTFIHCAANMRVSAFVFLYRVLHEKAAVAEAQRDLNAIWQPDEVWERFIKEQLS